MECKIPAEKKSSLTNFSSPSPRQSGARLLDGAVERVLHHLGLLVSLMARLIADCTTWVSRPLSTSSFMAVISA